VTGTYVYDETNKMVSGTNDIGEQSLCTYDGLGATPGSSRRTPTATRT
jgi:hypothetical protein